MSGRGRKDENEGEGGGGWASTFWKVASAAAATAVVAGGLYSVLKQPKAEQVAVEAGGSGGAQPSGAQPKVWTRPKVGWLKLNVDGSRLPEIQSAGCGGVLRNDSGKWLIGFAQKLDPSLRVDETEIEGILRGMKWAKKKIRRLSKLEVESDNEGVVKKITNGTKSDDPRILEIRELLDSSDWQATLASIDGGHATKVADKLADIASRELTSYDLKEFDHPLESCRTALADDLHLSN